MAVKKEAYDVKVQIRIENRTDSYGKTAVKTMSLGQIKLGATDQELLDAGSALAGLSSMPLAGIRRIDTGDLVEG